MTRTKQFHSRLLAAIVLVLIMTTSGVAGYLWTNKTTTPASPIPRMATSITVTADVSFLVADPKPVNVSLELVAGTAKSTGPAQFNYRTNTSGSVPGSVSKPYSPPNTAATIKLILSDGSYRPLPSATATTTIAITLL